MAPGDPRDERYEASQEAYMAYVAAQTAADEALAEYRRRATEDESSPETREAARSHEELSEAASDAYQRFKDI